ncbi:HAD hydrolase family protein [Enterococcus sp. 5H]|uniref:HAD hydrolase family protein n=1 Tax=Enterococcus sp. 5H TaxID=1229490 RepID=UPI0023039C1F|nr:HAD hydrolase family protein [Enterococcus sp. 5H]MDA9472804.1 hypothetical protein [Enterococcus sp. 5H]
MTKQLIFIKDTILLNTETAWFERIDTQKYFPVLVSQLSFSQISPLVDPRFKAFVCLNGQQIILDNQTIRCNYIPEAEIIDLIQFCSYTKHPLALYRTEKTEITQINETVEKYQKQARHDKLIEVDQFTNTKDVLLVKVFNELTRKDIFYETFYHERLAFQRIDSNTVILGTFGYDEIEAIHFLKEKIRPFINEDKTEIIRTEKQLLMYR